MTVEDILGSVADQDKGRVLDLFDPFTGAPLGMKFWIAGPDSDTARRARLRLTDELTEMADIDGRVSAESREAARITALAALVLRWVVNGEDGKPLPLTTLNIKTLLRVGWIHEQIDAFAGDRRNFAPATAWNSNSVDISTIGR